MSTDPTTPDLLAALMDSIARARKERAPMKPSFAKKPEGTATVDLDDLDDSQAAASQVQGAAEVGADVEALAEVIRAIDGPASLGGQDLARGILAAGWVPPERVAEARVEELRLAAIAARGMHDPTAPDCAEWADWLDARADRIAERGDS